MSSISISKFFMCIYSMIYTLNFMSLISNKNKNISMCRMSVFRIFRTLYMRNYVIICCNFYTEHTLPNVTSKLQKNFVSTFIKLDNYIVIV